MFLMLLGCGYDLVAADLTLVVAPPSGSPGIQVDTVIPMRLELYGPELDGGITTGAFHGYVDTALDAEVACLDDVFLEAIVRRDQVGLFFRSAEVDAEDVVRGAIFTSGGTTSRKRGHADAVLDFEFPCLPDLVPHSVAMEWEVDRSAPIPYDDVP